MGVHDCPVWRPSGSRRRCPVHRRPRGFGERPRRAPTVDRERSFPTKVASIARADGLEVFGGGSGSAVRGAVETAPVGLGRGRPTGALWGRKTGTGTRHSVVVF